MLCSINSFHSHNLCLFSDPLKKAVNFQWFLWEQTGKVDSTLKKKNKEMQRTKKILSKIKPASSLELHTIHSQCSYVCKDRNQDEFSLQHVYSSLLRGKGPKLVKGKEGQTAGKPQTLKISSWVFLASTFPVPPSFFFWALSYTLADKFVYSHFRKEEPGTHID